MSVIVADVHERMALVGKAQSTGPVFRNVDREAISVGKLEVRAQHRGTVWALCYVDLFAKPLAQEFLRAHQC